VFSLLLVRIMPRRFETCYNDNHSYFYSVLSGNQQSLNSLIDDFNLYPLIFKTR